MEFDEINTLINIEREKFQKDLTTISENIKQDKAKIYAEKAEKAALLKTKQCAYDVEQAVLRLKEAMKEHATRLKTLMSL